ncbi:MAG: GNAT family N-acetyltransferase [Bacteriovoracaceae bacterium]|nr:GNAT family N-acetyltransferase [Bacteriovoracaceae bacterium]
MDQLPLTFKRRMNMWKRVISEVNEVLQVAEDKSGIIGFATFSKGRDVGSENMAEVGAIYLLEKYKGKGIGYSLLSSGFKRMKEQGFKEAYCWVLEGNTTIKFYERSGAKFTGKTKEAEIGGKKVLELAYQWDMI